MDIVERLRLLHRPLINGDDGIEPDDTLGKEAADEIERLKQINERFAKILNGERVVMPADGHWSHMYGTEGE